MSALVRRFALHRVTDETGISGTGRVAEGVQFSNGWCAMVWLTAHTSCAFYTSIDEVTAIHGHAGKTHIVFDDPEVKEVCPDCSHAVSDHWMDNCGGCFIWPCQCNLMNAPKWNASKKALAADPTEVKP